MNEKELTHIDLFSGIGGFSLAGEWARFRTIAFCEKDDFCKKALQKHWPKVPIIPEIRDFDGTKYRGATLLTGGFPCQPFSVAGQRRGKNDDRYLWPEMLRVIKEAKPRWVLAENVPGIVKLALGQVLSDLESIGYDFPRDHEGTPIVPVIPACSQNAPHRRYRVWIIAYSESRGIQGRPISIRQRQSRQATCNTKRSHQDVTDSQSRMSRKQAEQEGREGFGGGNKDASDSDRFNSNDARYGSSEIPQQEETEIFGGNITDSSSKGLPKSQKGQFNESLSYAQRGDWEKDWYEVAAQFCRVDDGVSDRIHRLKALGNAIVPQIACEIMEKIAWIERNLME